MFSDDEIYAKLKVIAKTKHMGEKRHSMNGDLLTAVI